VVLDDIDPETRSPYAVDDPVWVARADAIIKKVFNETTLADTRDGIFTYFVYKNKHSSLFDEEHGDPEAIHIGCIKVRSGLEFGTAHINLADYLGLYSPDLGGDELRRSATLLFAGEMLKEGPSITYNFFSGTFIFEHNVSLSRRNLDALKRIHRQRCTIMEALLEKNGLKGTFTDTSLSDLHMPPFGAEEQRDLESLGLTVKLFDDQEKCEKYFDGDEDEDEDEDGDD